MIMNDAYVPWKTFSKKTMPLLTHLGVVITQKDLSSVNTDFVFQTESLISYSMKVFKVCSVAKSQHNLKVFSLIFS